MNDAKHDFKINFYFAILDTTISSISERFQQLQQHNEDFEIIHNINQLKQWDNKDLLKHWKDLHIKLADGANLNDEDINGNSSKPRIKNHLIFYKI